MLLGMSVLRTTLLRLLRFHNLFIDVLAKVGYIKNALISFLAAVPEMPARATCTITALQAVARLLGHVRLSTAQMFRECDTVQAQPGCMVCREILQRP
jgi:hypothetical protein